MPSRQERREAERDAAKRKRAAASAGAAGAAAALANLDVDPGGDWTTQAEDPYVGRHLPDISPAWPGSP